MFCKSPSTYHSSIGVFCLIPPFFPMFSFSKLNTPFASTYFTNIQTTSYYINITKPHTFPIPNHALPIMPLLSTRFFSHLRLFSSMANLTSVTVTPKASRLRGVVFDMDGTLTVPAIDFPAMYRTVLGEDEYRAVKLKSPSGIDILHHIESWGPEKQRKAYEIIADFERQGLDRLQIMPGASELCGFLDSQTIRRGLITRNVKAAVDLFQQRFGITFSPALSREFRPYKPDPAPLLHICTTWEVQPNEVMMIGDSLKDDVACGKQAGAFTCLLDETGRYNSPEYAGVEFQPDYTVSSLSEVVSLLETNFVLAP